MLVLDFTPKPKVLMLMCCKVWAEDSGFRELGVSPKNENYRGPCIQFPVELQVSTGTHPFILEAHANSNVEI